MRLLTAVEQAGPATGAAVAAFQMARELAGRGYDLDLLYMQDGAYLRAWQQLCRTVTQVAKLDVYGLRHDGPTLHRLVPAVRAGRRAQPDLVWDNRYWSLPVSRAVAGRRLPVVCHSHGFVDPPAKTDRLLTRLADLFVAVSDYNRDCLVERGADVTRVRVVYKGIDPASYPAGGDVESARARAALGLPADAFVVLYFGRLHPSKGIEVLADAVGQLPGDVELVMAGPHEREDYVAELRRRARGRAHVLGLRTDVVTPLHAADVVVVPTIGMEAFGRTIIEGMATGRPVLGSQVGGIPEILTGRFARFLFPRGDVAALAAKLAEMRSWRADEPELALACTRHVQENFTMTQTIDGLEEVLREAAR